MVSKSFRYLCHSPLPRHTGLTHDLFFLFAGRWGCAVSAMHLDELTAATALSWALLRLKAALLRGWIKRQPWQQGQGAAEMPHHLQVLDGLLSVVCCVAGFAYCSEMMAGPLSRFVGERWAHHLGRTLALT